MKTTIRNWYNLPLFRTEAKVINTPTKSDNEIDCNGVALRYNLGNIHEIKTFWNVSTK